MSRHPRKQTNTSTPRAEPPEDDGLFAAVSRASEALSEDERRTLAKAIHAAIDASALRARLPTVIRDEDDVKIVNSAPTHIMAALRVITLARMMGREDADEGERAAVHAALRELQGVTGKLMMRAAQVVREALAAHRGERAELVALNLLRALEPFDVAFGFAPSEPLPANALSAIDRFNPRGGSRKTGADAILAALTAWRGGFGFSKGSSEGSIKSAIRGARKRHRGAQSKR